MRFIGSKGLLLDKIKKIIDENINFNNNVPVFCDIFSGTATVARNFKKDYKIISNDMIYFSYVLQMATIHNNKRLKFKKLDDYGIKNPFKYLENTDIYSTGFNDSDFFIYQNYSPNDKNERMYFTSENAKRIDFIRLTIEKWNAQNLIDEDEYYYLIMSLIEGVPYVSNITGTYGAYLKHWDKRAFKNFKMIDIEVEDNGQSNKCFNIDGNKLIDEISGDVLYIDPPYNNRQYIPNYHLLETVAKYDYPNIYGKTGLRPYKEEKSDYCIANKVNNAFEDLINKANFSHIILSYSTDGLMSVKDIESILKKYGKKDTYKLYKFAYRKYKSKHKQKTDKLKELIFYIEKEEGA